MNKTINNQEKEVEKTNLKNLSFSLKDKVLGDEVSLSNVTLPLFKEFLDQISIFLRGQEKTNISEIKTSLITGSIQVNMYDDSNRLDKAIIDYQTLKKHGTLDLVDPVRASIVDIWQNAIKNNPDRRYEIKSLNEKNDSISLVIDSNSFFKPISNGWINEDQYLVGQVFDMGGKYKSNVHLELDNGSSVKISAKSDILSKMKENKLYKKQLVRVTTQRNINSGQTKDEKLISFEPYNPKFDEDEFEELVKKGTEAWRSVTNPAEWVNQLRNNYG